MKTISRRILKLEDRLRPRLATADGWSAKEELLKELQRMAERMRSVGLVPENGPVIEAAR